MNNNLFFLIISTALLVLSVITVCHAPIINGAVGNNDYMDEWNEDNCKKRDDDYKHDKDHDRYNLEEVRGYIDDKIAKRKITECKRHHLMFSFEYVAFIVDVVLGFICFILGFIHYLEPGNKFEKVSGIIGLISGIIIAVLTIVYVAFSALIFNNEAIRGESILYPNKASYHWNGQKYIHDYDEEKDENEDSDIKFIKFKDLGKKQYNYDSEFYRMSIDSTDKNEYKNCQYALTSSDISTQKYYQNVDTTKLCEYVWEPGSEPYQDSTDNKFLYDRWLTTIIFGVLITVCGLCVGLFGLLLFKNSANSAPESSPVPETVNN